MGLEIIEDLCQNTSISAGMEMIIEVKWFNANVGRSNRWTQSWNCAVKIQKLHSTRSRLYYNVRDVLQPDRPGQMVDVDACLYRPSCCWAYRVRRFVDDLLLRWRYGVLLPFTSLSDVAYVYYFFSMRLSTTAVGLMSSSWRRMTGQ